MTKERETVSRHEHSTQKEDVGLGFVGVVGWNKKKKSHSRNGEEKKEMKMSETKGEHITEKKDHSTKIEGAGHRGQGNVEPAGERHGLPKRGEKGKRIY